MDFIYPNIFGLAELVQYMTCRLISDISTKEFHISLLVALFSVTKDSSIQGTLFALETNLDQVVAINFVDLKSVPPDKFIVLQA